MSNKVHYVYISLLVMILVALVFIGMNMGQGKGGESKLNEVKCMAFASHPKNAFKFLNRPLSPELRKDKLLQLIESKEVTEVVKPYIIDGWRVVLYDTKNGICFAR